MTIQCMLCMVVPTSHLPSSQVMLPASSRPNPFGTLPALKATACTSATVITTFSMTIQESAPLFGDQQTSRADASNTPCSQTWQLLQAYPTVGRFARKVSLKPKTGTGTSCPSHGHIRRVACLFLHLSRGLTTGHICKVIVFIL
jgi:hypothetical protein